MKSQLALKYLDQILLDRTGQDFRAWVGERRPKGEETSWHQIALEMTRVTGVDSPASETIRRWYEKP